METLTLLDTIIQDWKIIAAAFAFGGFFWQAKIWFKKITLLLENTGRVHGQQNAVLDNINDKMDNLDKRMAKLEGSVEMIIIENHQQSIKLAVLETQQDLDKPVRKRRQQVQ
jgi:hypothetical protein